MLEIADGLDLESPHAEDWLMAAPAEDWLMASPPAVDVHDRDELTTQPSRPQIPDVGPGGFGLRVKRAFDVVVGSVLLIPAVPVGVAIAVAIRRSSPGPVLFRQTRVGFRGRHFEVLKFRTMVHDADARKAELLHMNESDGLFKIKADPRVTNVGKILRRTYLDELPQLINVVRGEMSLVGPRPLVPDEDASVRGSGRQRLQVPPGMTGEWQVLRGGGASRDEMIALDYRYVAGWNLWRDIRCLVKTAVFMFARKGW